MKIFYILLSFIALTRFELGAIDVVSRAGELNRVVSDHGVTALTVNGSVNAADFDFINSCLADLRSLDLSGVSIAAYDGDKLLNGRWHSVADELPEYSLAGSRIESLVLPRSLRSLGEGCLAGSAIRSLEIPAGVTALGTAFCDGCADLASVVIPVGVTEVPNLGFKGCISLAEVEIPADVEVIGREAFKGCAALRAVKGGSGVTMIADEAFCGCTGLEEFDFPKNIKYIGCHAFGGAPIASLDLAECGGLMSIGSWAFAGCNELSAVTLPASVTAVGEGVFFDCHRLESVTLPAGLGRLSAYALKGTESVKKVVLPSSLSALGDYAMAGMTGVESVDATGLEQVPELGESVFEWTASDEVALIASADMVPVFKVTPQWQEFNVVAKDVETSSDIIVTDAADKGKLEMSYDGSVLHIKARAELDRVEVYDLQGRAVVRADAARATAVSVALHGGRTLIVRAVYADGDAVAVKTKL